ncbi:MAG: response regulator [Nitrospinae bacterium]|nr:response regulator [Nitrospinota bacterium]
MSTNYEFAGMRVLIIEDMVDNANLLSRIAKKHKLETAIAYEGLKGLDMVPEFAPDLILLDIGLPDTDGFEICSRLKFDNQSKDIPVIFITAFTESANVVKGFSLGAVDYITKPFRAAEVISRISNQLRLRKSQKELITNENLYRNIVNKIPQLILKLDIDRKITFANPSFHFLGYDPESLLGRPLEYLLEGNQEELAEKIATRNVGPLAVRNLEADLIVNSSTSKNSTSKKFFIDASGIWDVPDEEVFEGKTKKNFLGTLCIGNTVPFE